MERGDFEAARSCLERALVIQEQVLTPDHPEKAQTFKNLGALHQATGNARKAREYYERAQSIYENSVVPTHPDLQAVRERVAALA